MSTPGPGHPDRYELVIRRAARRALAEELPLDAAIAVGELLAGDLLANPHRVGKRLYPPLDHLHSARRGEYRVLYEIDDTKRTVTVESIRHRRNAYRT
jgi:mRNA interferase RelE/StbE